VVELGTLIGKNWGKVTQIKPQELIITEEYRDPIENELIINEVTMRLPDLAELEKNR
jgi:Tfp pilus assembly protein PilP